MILLIDNYDSFAHNLARYLRLLAQEVVVVRNDLIDVAAIEELHPQAIVLSPGPCTPNEAGCSLEVVRQLHARIPMLGICLGHQTIAAALGAEIVRATTSMHGRTSIVVHDDSELFSSVPPQFSVCRYHSLVVAPTSLPAQLQATAHCKDGTIMALRHREHPIFGLQFHPEAILTEHGFQLLNNFLSSAGLASGHDVAALAASEYRRPAPSSPSLPEQPVTF